MFDNGVVSIPGKVVEIMSNVNLTLGLLSLIFLFTILVLVIAWRRRGAMLAKAIRQQTEIDHFLDLFSRSLRSADELSDSMDQAAEHIAELVMAESVCIYRMEDKRLYVAGVSGKYPLSQATIDMDENTPEEVYKQALREEDI